MSSKIRKVFLAGLAGTLMVLARLTLKRYRPRIVGITGNVGKTSTKLAACTVLRGSAQSASRRKKVRMAGGNLNNEYGLPLAVLTDYERPGGAFFWLWVIVTSVLRLVSPWSKRKYPKVLILEYAADKPGDIRYLTKIVKPNIAVVTAVGGIPVHLEFFTDRESIIKEKTRLVKGLGGGETAILNHDDPAVLNMRNQTKARVITYGFDKSADLRITDFEDRSEFGRPLGISFKLETGKSSVPVKIDNVFGKAQAYAAAAAAAVGLSEGLNLVQISESLADYEGEKGRVKLIPGIKQSWIIDDSYNSSPASLAASLEIFSDLRAPRKVAILGDMLELGNYARQAHEKMGELTAKAVDELITVGPLAKLVAENTGLKKKNIRSFRDTSELLPEVRDLIEEKDLVLVKGSQSMRMEKVVAAIMAEPGRAKELLVRQFGRWLE